MPRSKASLRKIKSLIFLMLLTLILAITATYAWFSTQRDIEVSGMRLNVEVAESLQISLDGETWTQSIQIANMRQFYGTYTGTGDSFAIYQAKKPDDGGNTNYVPTELLPVSSAGEVSNGKLQFVQGTIENNANGTIKLKGITACSENDLTPTETVANRQNGNSDHPYLVFDMYLRNISAKTAGLDELLLNAGSSVWVNGGTTDDGEQEGKGVSGTGLEYSARVGMVVYGNTISTTATDTAEKTIGEQIRELGPKGNEVAAIWEPNNKEHTAYVVATHVHGITSTSEAVSTYGIKSSIATASPNEIANIYSSEDSNMVRVKTFTPKYTTVDNGVDTKTTITDTNGNNLGIAPNQISKVRVYIWLEGQDPDCVDLASTGDKLNVTLKLTKDEENKNEDNTYTGPGTNTAAQSGDRITANELSISDYGTIVTNYAAETSEAQKSVDWRIFHTDGNNIYLIAGDYIDTTYVPAGRNNTEISPSALYPKGFSLSPYNDYAGSSDITINHPAKRWFSQYTYESTNNNMTATAYLLDTSVWNPVFANSNYAEYAVGGPTIELFAISYNATHKDKTINTIVSDINGYKIKWSNANYETMLEGLDTNNDLYIITDDTNANGMWIASPSGVNSAILMSAESQGKIWQSHHLSDENGARPVVMLKSNIKLEKQEDNTFKIVE